MQLPMYRIIQWATGNVGRHALRMIVERPDFDPVGIRPSRSEAKTPATFSVPAQSGQGHRRLRRDPRSRRGLRVLHTARVDAGLRQKRTR